MVALERLCLVVPATLVGARGVTERIMGLCEPFSAEDRILYATAVMEWLVNVVKHSYAGALGAYITIHVVPGSQSIELIIEDTGKGMPSGGFNAAPREFVIDAADVAQLPETGRGISIVKSVMDTVQYESVDGINRFTAVKRWRR